MSFCLEHLSEIERAEIARVLFKVKSTDANKGELHGLCPFHEEKNPSFSYNYKKDAFKCFSCDAAGDLIKLWSHVHAPGLDEKEAFKQFCEAHNIQTAPKSADPAKDEAARERAKVLKLMREAWAAFPPLPDAMVKKLQKTRGWDPQTIKNLDLRLETRRLNKDGKLEDVTRRVKIAIPIFDEKNELCNIRLYQPGAKNFKIISFGKGVGASRLFPARPAAVAGPVILCEGESDTICALSRGLNAITQTSKLTAWPAGHIAALKDREVVIAYDTDEPGQKYASHAAQSLVGKAKSVRMIAWPDFMLEGGKIAKKHGQDLTDFFVTHNKTREDFDALASAAPLYDPANDPWKRAEYAGVSGVVSGGGSPGGGGGDESGRPSFQDFFARGVNDRLSFKPRLLAERILADVKLMSDPESGMLFRWNGKYWEEYSDDYVLNIALNYLGVEAKQERVRDVLFQAKKLSVLPHGRKLNDRENWICIQNGLLNVETFELASHDPSHLNTYILPVSLTDDPTKRCDRFLKYLETNIVDAGPINQVQEFAGYCFERHVKYDKCLFLLGPGEDGKSKLLRVLEELVGKENCAAVSVHNLEDQFHRSSLYHKLLNTSTEIGSGLLESPFFKAITTGDTINAAFKTKDVFEFKPYCKLAFAGNTLPRSRDNSHGFYRRWLPIRFKRQFLPGDPERDPNLIDKFRDELPEIFRWALEGLHRLRQQGYFTDCEETREIMLDYRRSNNAVLCFVEERCRLDAGESTEKDVLYGEYEEYCTKGGYKRLNKDNFFRELLSAINNLRAYRPQVNGERKNHIKGIALGQEHEI